MAIVLDQYLSTKKMVMVLPLVDHGEATFKATFKSHKKGGGAKG